MNRKLITTALLTGAAALAPSALAQTADWTGLYVGVQAGLAKELGKTERVAFDTNRAGNFNDTVFTAGGANAFSPGFCNGSARGATEAAGCRAGQDVDGGPLVHRHLRGQVSRGAETVDAQPAPGGKIGES